MLSIVDALMSDYHLNFIKAMGGQRRGKRKWGFPLDVALALWPALLARHGVDISDQGPTSPEAAYIEGAARKRAELLAAYRLVK